MPTPFYFHAPYLMQVTKSGSSLIHPRVQPVVFFALRQINIQDLEDLSKNLDTRFIETKRFSLADFGWHVIKEGTDSNDARIVQLKGIFEEIINTPWVYGDLNNIKTIHNRFNNLSFNGLHCVPSVLAHFNNVFTNNFEFNFLKSLLLERKFLDEIKSEGRNSFSFDINHFDRNHYSFIRNYIPDENVFKEAVKNINIFIDQDYNVDMLFMDRANSFCLNRNELKNCLQKAYHSNSNSNWYFTGSTKRPFIRKESINPQSIESLRWLCSKRQNPSESDFLTLSILRNCLLDKELKDSLECYLEGRRLFASGYNPYTLRDFIQAYKSALEKDQQASQNDMPFYELNLPDEELNPLKQEPMDVEEESSESEPMDIEMEPADDNLFENNANNVSTNIIKNHARENVSIS